MCATAAMKGILLIETDKTRDGITPLDEAEFVADTVAAWGLNECEWVDRG